MRSLTLSLLLLLCLAVPAFACEPSRDASQFSLEDYVNNAEFIFVGTVVDGEGYNDASVIMTAEIEVTRYLKGSGSALVQLSGFGYGPDCLSTVDIGDELIFFANRASDGSLTAAYLSAHDAATGANPERIAELQAITGQSTAPQALPPDVQLTRFLSRYRFWIGGISLSLLILAGLILFTKRRPQGKPKMKREELL